MFRFLLLLAITVRLPLIVETTAEDKPPPADRLKAIQKEVADAETAFRDAWAKLPDIHLEDPEVEKLFQAFRKKQLAGFDAALEIAKANPKSDTGFDALEWLLTIPLAYHLPSGKQMLELMAQRHASNPKIGKAIAILAYYPPNEGEPNYPSAIALLKAVVAKNPDRMARGQAALGLAWQAKDKFRIAESRGREDTSRLAAEAEKAFETVLRDYGDCRNLRNRGARPATAKLAEEVEHELYELRNLRMDMPVPDIEGVDLDGTSFKLSDYRGKVVLLVFWASWCGPCMASVPHEKELVEHFKGRPFVLVGVNGDHKKEDARKAIAKHKIPWRSFWNGKEGPGGLIATTWNVRGWPTMYVIDHKGTIRHKYLHGRRLDEPLEKFVADAEATAKVGGPDK
jgi:peroxiredoxin